MTPKEGSPLTINAQPTEGLGEDRQQSEEFVEPGGKGSDQYSAEFLEETLHLQHKGLPPRPGDQNYGTNKSRI